MCNWDGLNWYRDISMISAIIHKRSIVAYVGSNSVIKFSNSTVLSCLKRISVPRCHESSAGLHPSFNHSVDLIIKHS